MKKHGYSVSLAMRRAGKRRFCYLFFRSLAGFLAGFLSGRSVEDSLALACACGSLSTLAAGGTAAQPTLAEALST